jgi:hypothetical protein
VRGRQSLGDLGERDVGRLLDQAENEGFARVELRARRLALLARGRLACLPVAAIPATRRGDPDPNRRAALRVESPSSIAAITRPRRSALKLCVILISSQITREMNQTSAFIGIPNPTQSSEKML